MIAIGHIVNPVKVGIDSDIFEAQPITFTSMLNAKDYSDNSENIKQLAIGFDEDIDVFPAGFVKLPSLNRSVMDVGSFTRKRKLPLIQDLLSPLKGMNNIEYIVYSNVDIALMPFFYNYIYSKIKSGSDSLIINRRVIQEKSDISIMLAEIGNSHPGYDCFVFRWELLKKFNLGNVCIGANWIGRVMIANLIMYSKSLEIIKDCHLTFHIGDDGAWLNNDYSEFDAHNKKEAYRIINHFIAITDDERKKIEFEKIIQFMDEWGRDINPVKKKRKKPTIIKKIKYKLRQLLS